MSTWKWFVIGYCTVAVGFVVYWVVHINRLVKLGRQRTAAHDAAIAAHKRGDMEEFDFFHKEWQRLASKCEQHMGIKR